MLNYQHFAVYKFKYSDKHLIIIYKKTPILFPVFLILRKKSFSSINLE